MTRISEFEVVAAAWPIYDRLLSDGAPGRLSSVWAEARQIAEQSLRRAREVAA